MHYNSFQLLIFIYFFIIPGFSSNGGGGNGGIFNMKIDTFDHKALMGPPKIPGLPDSVQLAPSLIENAAKKSNKKKKKSSSNHNSQYQNSQSLAVKNQIESEIDTHESIDANDSANQVEPAKKLRNLRKKLRDIETLVRAHDMFSRILNFLVFVMFFSRKKCLSEKKRNNSYIGILGSILILKVDSVQEAKLAPNALWFTY